MWKSVVGALALFVMLGFTAPEARADEGAIRDVIVSQLDAFQRDDFDDAFSFASPMIKRMFRTPDRFGAMVRGGYPMVWRPSSVRFGTFEERGGVPYQSVLLEDAQGKAYVAEYEMIRVGGDWQINGVRILPGEQLGV
ncbi:MAG: DUF4864 domain-containing protein [Pseudomonadota bacterium]